MLSKRLRIHRLHSFNLLNLILTSVMVKFFMSSRIGTNLYIDMIKSVLRPFGRSRSVINRVLHLFATPLSELVKIRVSVANFVPMTLFFHSNSAYLRATTIDSSKLKITLLVKS